MSLRTAINSKCRECTYDAKASGTWREQVAQCTVIRCALWSVRPAPSGGRFADPPRNPATVGREWLKAPHGCGEMGHPSGLAGTSERTAGGAA